jgi:hypothetical protein
VGLLLSQVGPGEIQRGDVILGSEMNFEWKPLVGCLSKTLHS